MTVLIGWIGVEHQGPSSAYLMSDSRLTWGAMPGHFDYGAKLLALENSPDIFGYCGDVVFATQVFFQLSTSDKAALLFKTDSSSLTRVQRTFELIKSYFTAYPEQCDGSIYHISRDLNKTFHAYCYKLNKSTNMCTWEELAFDHSKSSLIFAGGSGAKEFQSLLEKYKNNDLGGTSRNIYQCFCDSLMNSKIRSCGGTPQLVGLYKSKFNGFVCGTVYQGQRYLMGGPAMGMENYNTVRWYNEEFEICDGNTMERFPYAMRQPNPNR